MSVIDEIILHKLPDDQYVRKSTDKHQIYMHHTAGSSDPYNAIKWWASTRERVAVSFVIGGVPRRATQTADGTIVQCYSSAYAGWHLGLKQKHLLRGGKSATWLNLNTIGIELASWGQLTLKDGKFLTYAKTTVPESEVVTYDTPFRGFIHYHRYSDAQLESSRKLLQYLCDRWDIEKAFKGMAIFDIDPRALKGESGIFTHVSVRPDKFDCHPQPELIQMLSSL